MSIPVFFSSLSQVPGSQDLDFKSFTFSFCCPFTELVRPIALVCPFCEVLEESVFFHAFRRVTCSSWVSLRSSAVSSSGMSLGIASSRVSLPSLYSSLTVTVGPGSKSPFLKRCLPVFFFLNRSVVLVIFTSIFLSKTHKNPSRGFLYFKDFLAKLTGGCVRYIFSCYSWIVLGTHCPPNDFSQISQLFSASRPSVELFCAKSSKKILSF